MNHFIKPAIDVTQQIELLRKRGLQIKDCERAKSYLEVVSYFRLSAYMRPFQLSDSDHQFKENTQFKTIVDLYAFDRECRLLVMDAIERVEVAVRSSLNNHMGPKYQTKDECNSGSHWYLQGSLFKRSYAHKRLLKEIEEKQSKEQNDLRRDIQKIERTKADDALKAKRIERRIRENYPRFYEHSYSKPHLMPGWAMVEELTFGSISHIYKGLAKDSDRKKIAKRFLLPHEVLESWLHTLNFVRNCCAHHSRLWNRELAIQPKKPNNELWQLPERLTPTQIQPQRRMYMVLLMLAHLMQQVSPDSQWHNKVKALIVLHPEVPLIPMGFPDDWQTHPFWSGENE